MRILFLTHNFNICVHGRKLLPLLLLCGNGVIDFYPAATPQMVCNKRLTAVENTENRNEERNSISSRDYATQYIKCNDPYYVFWHNDVVLLFILIVCSILLLSVWNSLRWSKITQKLINSVSVAIQVDKSFWWNHTWRISKFKMKTVRRSRLFTSHTDFNHNQSMLLGQSSIKMMSIIRFFGNSFPFH